VARPRTGTGRPWTRWFAPPHGSGARHHETVSGRLRTGTRRDGDAWPQFRQKLIDAQLLVVATPIWQGQPASVCKVVLERLDAELSETDEQGRMLTYGTVAVVAVVGSEDSAHHVTAEVLQALNDVGFTIPASSGTYWVGEAMQKTNYADAGDHGRRHPNARVERRSSGAAACRRPVSPS
jgi:multimeric flavodoxin WrbA